MQARDRYPGSAGILPASSSHKRYLRGWVTKMQTGCLRSQRWLASRRLLTLIAVTVCFAIFGWAIARSPGWLSRSSASAESIQADNIDHLLQRAAANALSDRRGTVIIMDPQTGRLRAVVNSKLAFEADLPPGSTIKPFTALAALRSGVIDEDSRNVCHEKYSHEEFQTTCSHPRDLPPLNPTEAIAYSCNYYFGKVGERLSESSFDSTLSEFGFGKPSGLGAEREASGSLRRRDWQAQNAIGEGDYLRVTPIQMLDAYAALVNGGHLFRPRLTGAARYVPELRANIAIKDEHRDLILRGMRGAVRYGTAETASLYSLPIYVFGKTGTATQIDGYRTQGWFVGFASASNESARSQNAGSQSENSNLSADISKPEEVKLAVLVFLTKAHGSEAAEVARPIFAEYARSQSEISNSSSQIDSGDAGSVPASPSLRVPASVVRVHLVRENVTRSLAVEDYVRGVVAAEGSTEREPEALKALAIASRTYVFKNLGRHAKDGYDFCTTTHCQRYIPAAADAPANASGAVSEAVAATRGEVLRDSDNQLADSYFSASCGGATANIATLWGGSAPPYLRGVTDKSCLSEAHHVWTDVISETQLLKALQSDPRTNVGERLASVAVRRTDSTGRAELIDIEGNQRLTVKGWDFKIIVGRALGWSRLKSSRFTVSRAGANFVFRGSGFGHGLGLCQEGAHVMAARGASYRQILAKYFPSTRIANETGSAADLIWRKPDPGVPRRAARLGTPESGFCQDNSADTAERRLSHQLPQQHRPARDRINAELASIQSQVARRARRRRRSPLSVPCSRNFH